MGADTGTPPPSPNIVPSPPTAPSLQSGCLGTDIRWVPSEHKDVPAEQETDGLTAQSEGEALAGPGRVTRAPGGPQSLRAETLQALMSLEGPMEDSFPSCPAEG